MKNYATLLITLVVSISLYAQAPQGFNYQGVARDVSGDPIPNQNISLRIGVFAGVANAYTETQSAITDDNGLFSLVIGMGTYETGIFTSFKDITFSGGQSWSLSISADFTGGTNYQSFGGPQLLRGVPFSYHARTASTLGDSAWVIETSPDPKMWSDSGFNVGIGTSEPDTTVHIVGKLKYQDSTEGDGKVLTSDAEGSASWQHPNQYIYQLDNTPAVKDSWDPPYVMEISSSLVLNNSKEVPQAIFSSYCGDLDGCELTLIAESSIWKYRTTSSLIYKPSNGNITIDELQNSTGQWFGSVGGSWPIMKTASDHCYVMSRSWVGSSTATPDNTIHLLPYSGGSSVPQRCVLIIKD